MAQDFKSEVIITYEKTIANMEEFTKALNNQISDIEKVNNAINKNVKVIDSLMKKYEETNDTNKKQRDFLQKREREREKALKIAEREIAQKKREKEAIERNLASYDKEYAAKRRIEKATEDLVKAQEYGYISEKKRMKLMEESIAANNLQAKEIDNLSNKYIKGYSANKKYLQTIHELFQANKLLVIDERQLNEELTKIQKAMEGGYSSTKELSKSTSKLSKDIHNLNLEYDKSYAMQVKYSKEFLKLQKAYNTTSMSLGEYQRRQKALNAEIARGGITLKELRKQQLATAKANREFRMSYDSSFASLRKYKEEMKIIQKQEKLGIITKEELKAKIKELDTSYKHNWQTIEDIKEANLKLAKSQHELRLEFDKSYAASFKYQQGLDKLQKAMAAGSMSDDNYIRRLKLLNEELKRGGQSHAQYREQQKKTIAKVREQAESLKALKAAHDPLYAAREKFKKQEAELKVLLESKNIDQNKFNETLQRYRDQLAKTLRTTNNSINAKKRERIELEKIAEKYDAVYAAEKRYSRTKRELERLLNANIITGKQFNDMLKVQEMKLKAAQGAGKGLINRLFRMRTAFKETGIAASISRTYVAALHKTWKAFFAIMAVQTFARWSTEFAKTGENIELMSRKLKHFTGEADNLPIVAESANRVGLDFEILNKTLTRFAITTRGAFDIKTMIKWTESLVKAGRVAGTTTQELSSGLLQLSQAMSAGRLMGDEYRSISENMPLLKQSIEDVFKEIGMGNASLKNMSREGKITTEVLIKAFGKLGTKVDGMGDTWDTIDAAISRLLVQWQLFVYQLTKGNSVFKELINSFARGLKFVREGLFGKLSDQTEQMVSSGDELQITLASVNTQLKNVADSTKSLSEPISTVTTYFSSFAQGLLGIEDAMASTGEEATALQKVFYALGAVAQIAIPLALGKGLLKKVYTWTGLKLIVEGVGVAFRKANGLFGRTTKVISENSKSVVSLADRFKKLLAVVKGVKTIFGGFITAFATGLYYLGEWVNKAKDAREEQAELGRTVLESSNKMKLLNDSANNFAKALSNGTPNVQDLKDKLSEYNSTVQTSISGIRELTEKRNELLNSTKEQEFWQSGSKNISNTFAAIRALSEGIRLLEADSAKASKMMEALGLGIESVGKKADKALSNFKNISLDIIPPEDKLDKHQKKFGEIMEKMYSGYKEARDLAIANGATEKELFKLREEYNLRTSTLINNLNNARRKSNKTSATEVKILDKKLKAQKEYMELIKAGIGGKQLEEARKKLEKYNGVADKMKETVDNINEAQKRFAKTLEESAKDLEFNIRSLEKTNPLLADYVKKVNDLSAKKALKTISQKEYNKQLEREQILLKEAQNEQETNRIESLREKYSSVYSAQKRYNETLKQVNELYKKRLITYREYAQSMLEARAAVIEAKAAQGDLAAILEKGSMKTVDDMGANFKDTFREVLDGNEDAFKNFNERMLNSFKDMLADMAYEALVKPIIVDIKTKLIGGSGALGQAANTVGGGIGGGSTGGLLGKAFSGIGDFFRKSFDLFSGNMAFANGAAFNNGVKAFADGGVVGSPTFFPMQSGTGLMGEDGPEAIVPLKRGKNGKLGIEGGGNTTNINVTVNVLGTNGNPEAIRRSAGQVAKATGTAINRSLRRNG